MDTDIFSPLALLAVLHDLPLNYAQIISLYDGEGNVSARYHMGKFDDFIDLEEVDHGDVKMRLFAQILSWEAKKWYKYLPACGKIKKRKMLIGGKVEKKFPPPLLFLHLMI